MKKILIAGGSGFLGKVLEAYFSKKGYKIIILTRSPKKENHILWDAETIGNWANELESTEILINLTGKSVDCRYTEKNKKLILNSRVKSTNILGQAINLCKKSPKVWLNASTATIYEYSLTKENSEESGKYGDDFSMNIAKSWENTFYSTINLKTRKIALRTSIVLGKNGGAIPTLKKLTKFGLGGKQGNGKQKVSWIHEQDFARAVEFIINNDNLSNSINLCVPKPTDNSTLMKSLRKVLGISFGVNQPKIVVQLGALLIGTESELVLKSRNVIPKILLDNGFKFQYTNIETALQQLIKSKS